MRLIEHAKSELTRAGLFDKDSDYAGMVGNAVMKLVEAHASEGHSGFSSSYVLMIFNLVVNFKALTPITDAPEEWTNVTTELWQSNRQSDLFSKDSGKTYYSINDEKREVHTSESTKLRDGK